MYRRAQTLYTEMNSLEMGHYERGAPGGHNLNNGRVEIATGIFKMEDTSFLEAREVPGYKTGSVCYCLSVHLRARLVLVCCMYVHVLTSVCMLAFVHVYISYFCLCARCVCVCVLVCVRVDTYAHACTYIHANMYVGTCSDLKPDACQHGRTHVHAEILNMSMRTYKCRGN
jgi:hypothetical protein